jgi:hypothetical protein
MSYSPLIFRVEADNDDIRANLPRVGFGTITLLNRSERLLTRTL